MTQKEYEVAINKAREIVLSNIEMFDEIFEEIKKEELEREKKIKMIEPFLQLLLLTAHTERGKNLFIKTLEYSKKIDLRIAYKFWNIYDNIEDLVTNRHFNITMG